MAQRAAPPSPSPVPVFVLRAPVSAATAATPAAIQCVAFVALTATLTDVPVSSDDVRDRDCNPANSSLASDSAPPTLHSLVTGDAEGVCILWNLATYRPITTWQAHEKALLNVAGDPTARSHILTQGRDNALHVWDASAAATAAASTIGGNGAPPAPAPVLVYTLPVSSLGFFRFDCCADAMGRLLVVVPNVLETAELDVFDLTTNTPVQRSLAVPAQSGAVSSTSATAKTTGMAMAARFLRSGAAGRARRGGDNDDNIAEGAAPSAMAASPLWLVAGYESGLVALWDFACGQLLARVTLFEQPVLSMDVADDATDVYVGAAEAQLCRVAVGSGGTLVVAGRAPLAGCRGVDSVGVRRDGRLVIAGCWDGSFRLLAGGTLASLGVVRQPHRQGISSVAFLSASRPASPPTATATAAVALKSQNEAAMVPATRSGDHEGETGGAVLRRDRRVRAGGGDGGGRGLLLRDVAPANLVAVGSKDGRVSLWRFY
ncbi:hypothetical protein HK405_012850 [Cladochytrium tenue]|nr:hypothetical protein HK405_012850 [Cladochytrium tenue]